ncbi:MAG: lipopolysaccharide biosynthesis protein [Senegalia sp. (in: firmicutes)]|uniref:lipopolysaccharide biosynthesis protein n=1 Tax=Senegalia sp. (in: firmicutes) TaxID=1924098 RepID=UPI003F94BC18
MSNRDLLKGTSIYTISGVLTKAGSIIILPLLIRYLTPSEYGVIGALTPIVQIMSTILICGLNVAQMRNYNLNKKNETIGSYIFTLNTFIILLSITMYFILSNDFAKRLWGYIFDLGEINFSYIKAYIILGSLDALIFMAISYFQMEKRYKRIGIGSIVSFIVNFGLTFLLIINFKMGVTGRILGILAGKLFLISVHYLNYMKNSKFKFRKDFLKDSLAIGTPMILTGLLGTLINYSDRIILAKFSSLEVVGYYSLAYTGGLILLVFIDSFINAWTPVFYDKIEKNKKDKSLVNTIEIFIAGLVLVAIAGELFSKEIIYFIFPTNYYNTVDYLPYIISSSVLQGFVYYLSLFLFHFKDNKYTSIVSGLSAGINILINIIFIPRYGVMVAVWSTIISFILSVTIYFTIIRVKYKFSFKYIKLISIYLLSLNPLIIYLFESNIGLINFLLKLLYFAVALIIILRWTDAKNSASI